MMISYEFWILDLPKQRKLVDRISNDEITNNITNLRCVIIRN